MQNPREVLKETGLLEEETTGPKKEKNGRKMECGICLEELEEKGSYSLGCKHTYCVECWRDYLHFEIEKGASCIYSECMKKDCKQLCHEECYQKLIEEAHLQRYQFYLQRSFIADNPTLKYCPSPGCSFAIQSPYKNYSEPVTCLCGFTFWFSFLFLRFKKFAYNLVFFLLSFKCGDSEIGNHSPSPCKFVQLWIEKNQGESENINYLKVNCKKCPKCSSHIEKNGGCMVTILHLFPSKI